MRIGVMSGLMWFAGFVVAHALLVHWRPPAGRFRVLAVTFLGALAGHAATAWLMARPPTPPGAAGPGGLPVVVGTGTLVIIAAVMLYLPFYYTVKTSLSVQTLIRVADAPDARLPHAVVCGALTSGELIRGRMETLVGSGYLARRGDRYVATRRGRGVARFFHAVQALWRLGPGG